MNSDVFEIGFTDSESEEAEIIPADAKLSIVNWEKMMGHQSPCFLVVLKRFSGL